ncbi:MAG: right-handed parallel beta-helix repeat-containing protein, partial [Candidatus Bathyarchaeota archaeon]
NTQAEFSHNDIKSVIWRAGVYVEQGLTAFHGWDLGPYGDFPELSSVLVKDNTIRAVGWADGVSIMDWASVAGEGKSVDAVVSDNIISLNTGYGGVFGWSAQDIKVLNNRFEGIGWYGIYVHGSGWEIIDNNVKDLDADMADVWLGWGSSDCFVRGKKGTVVLDQGIDNTIIIGD